MRTYEEVIAENPDTVFFVDGDDFYCDKDYSLISIYLKELVDDMQ